jgi:ketosteroid isomerase-like protein
MSQENVEIVQRMFAAWANDDLPRCLARFDDELVIHPIIGGVWHGPEGVLAMAADWLEGLAEWSMAPQDFAAVGNRVMVHVHQSARGEASGVPVESDYWWVYTVSAGKIVRWDLYAEQSEAHEAARLLK